MKRGAEMSKSFASHNSVPPFESSQSSKVRSHDSQSSLSHGMNVKLLTKGWWPTIRETKVVPPTAFALAVGKLSKLFATLTASGLRFAKMITLFLILLLGNSRTEKVFRSGNFSTPLNPDTARSHSPPRSTPAYLDCITATANASTATQPWTPRRLNLVASFSINTSFAIVSCVGTNRWAR